MNSGPGMTDAVGLGIFLASLIYAPNVAAIIGPYIVIILASVIGASFALKRREKTTRLAAVWYFGRVAGLAILLTGALASWASTQYDGWSERALIAPIALFLGSVGDDYPKLFQWFVQRGFSLLDFVRPKKGGPE